MADLATIGVALASGAFPVALVKIWDRYQGRRHAAEQGELGRVHEAHAECREEVAALRNRIDDQSTEIATVRLSVVACETKHAAAEAKVNALDTLVQYLMRQSRTHDTDPPPGMEPAE